MYRRPVGRRQHGRLRERDREISGPGGPDAGAVAVRGRGGSSLADHVLSLQRDYGNTAVTGIVVQRAPKGKTLGAASTDIKDVIKSNKGPGKGGGKKAPVEQTYWPEENPKFRGVDTPTVTAGALKWASQGEDKNTLSLATEYLEEAFVRQKSKMWIDLLWKTYKKLGDKKREAFWLKVKNGELKVP